MKSSPTYNEDSIKVLKGLDTVRKRPVMYLGERGSQMIWRMLKEPVDNAGDEFSSGRNDYIEVYINSKTNEYIIKDRAQGIPVGQHKTENKSTLEVVMTTLHAGGKFDDNSYKFSAGCFVGETKVFTLDGKHFTFDQLYKRWKKDKSPIPVISLHVESNKPTIGEIYHVQLSKYVDELTEVTLDNGKIIRSTVDHPYYTSSGKKVEAQDLEIGDSLNSIHFKEDRDGYLYAKRIWRLNRFVAENCGENILGKHVHHFGVNGRELKQEAESLNHKVVKVKTIKVKKVPVYGISVRGEHNYLLEAGVFVANTHGIGVSATNAVSTILKVWTYRDGKCWHQEYAKGKPKFNVREAKIDAKISKLLTDKTKQGTILYFVPDQTVVSKENVRAVIGRNQCLNWLSNFALLNKGLTIQVTFDDKQFTFINRIGVEKMMTSLEKSLSATRSGRTFILEVDNCTCAFAFSDYVDGDGLKSYVCNSPTKNGGTHVKGFVNAFTKSIQKHVLKKDKFKSSDLMGSIIGILHWRMSEPEFTSQIKDCLDSNVTKEVEELLGKHIDTFFAKNKKLARDIIKRASHLTSSREAYKKVMQAVSDVKKASNRSLLPTILASAVKARPEDRDIYLCEGDSAFGSCKLARDSAFQEVMKLKGKPINSMRECIERVLGNEVIQNIIVALGVDTENTKKGGKQFEATNLRAQNLYLLADADSDGPLVGNTKVLTLDGRNPTIKQLRKEWEKYQKPIWVYSYDSEGNVIPTEAFEPKIYRTVTKMALVKLDNGHTIKCTLSHKWVLNTDAEDERAKEYLGNFYVKAKDLKPGDSIKSLYFDFGNSDDEKNSKRPYRILKNDGKGKRIPVHKWVKKCLDYEGYIKYKKANKGITGGAIHIHHDDDNSLNNDPDNLVFISRDDHYAEHGDINRRAYNGSNKHLSDLKAFQSTESGKSYVKKSIDRLIDYNKSDEHRKVAGKNNIDPYFIERQKIGKNCRHAVSLIAAGFDLNEDNWNKFLKPGHQKWKTMKSEFGLIRILQEALLFGLTVKGADSLDIRTKNIYPTQTYSKFVTVCKDVIDRGFEVTEKNYDRVKKFRQVRGDPKWSTIRESLNLSASKLIKKVTTDVINNHKVASVTFEDCEPTDMYCLTVPETGNFMVDDGQGNGVCSSNCHINLLILAFIYKFIPDLIRQKRVHVVDAPLFHAYYKNKRYIGSTFEACYKQMPKGSPKQAVIRSKGWGECAPETLALIAFNPKTRSLITLDYPSTKEMIDRYESIVGDDTSVRKELLNL